MSFNGKGLIKLSNSAAECQIARFGANLVSYRPKGEEHDVFWLGDFNKFDQIQAIRGGVPVCWPRFAEEELNGGLPRHGFARLSDWVLDFAEADEDIIEAAFSLIPDKKYHLQVAARLSIKITDKLEYQLETINNGDAVFAFSEALHAYFNVSSLDRAVIKGLKGQAYQSSLDGQRYILAEDLTIKGEFDAQFINHAGTVEIEDAGFNRVISIEKSGSQTTVVWNPNKDLAEMSEGQHKHFVCVEPANTGASYVRLQPGEKHRIGMKISIRSLK